MAPLTSFPSSVETRWPWRPAKGWCTRLWLRRRPTRTPRRCPPGSDCPWTGTLYRTSFRESCSHGRSFELTEVPVDSQPSATGPFRRGPRWCRRAGSSQRSAAGCSPTPGMSHSPPRSTSSAASLLPGSFQPVSALPSVRPSTFWLCPFVTSITSLPAARFVRSSSSRSTRTRPWPRPCTPPGSRWQSPWGRRWTPWSRTGQSRHSCGWPIPSHR